MRGATRGCHVHFYFKTDYHFLQVRFFADVFRFGFVFFTVRLRPPKIAGDDGVNITALLLLFRRLEVLVFVLVLEDGLLLGLPPKIALD